MQEVGFEEVGVEGVGWGGRAVERVAAFATAVDWWQVLGGVGQEWVPARRSIGVSVVDR